MHTSKHTLQQMSSRRMVDDLRDLLDDLLGDYFNYFVRDFLGNLVLRVKNCRLRDLEVSEVSPILNDVRFDALGHAVELRVDVCDGGMDRDHLDFLMFHVGSERFDDFFADDG